MRSILFHTSSTRWPAAASSMPRSCSTASTSARWAVVSAMGDVAHVQDQVGADHLLQRGTEGGDQHGRQIGDEADGVGQDDAAAARQADLAHRRVERREHLVLGQHAGAGDPVEQRRLAGVGVADDRDDRIGHAGAALAVQIARAHDVLPAPSSAASMRSWMRRRSSSSWLSPGPPRKPAPPRWRSKWVQDRTSRLFW